MWHASVAGSIIRATLEHEARRQLAGVGDQAAGEWAEVGNLAFHVRRRLSAAEQASIGRVVDIRGSAEARERAGRLGGRLRMADPAILANELYGLGHSGNH